MDELKNLLNQLELGAASDPIYDMIMDQDFASMSSTQIEQSIRSILALHGCEACADPVIAALAEVKFCGLQPHATGDGKVEAAGDEGDRLASDYARASMKR